MDQSYSLIINNCKSLPEDCWILLEKGLNSMIIEFFEEIGRENGKNSIEILLPGGRIFPFTGMHNCHSLLLGWRVEAPTSYAFGWAQILTIFRRKHLFSALTTKV